MSAAAPPNNPQAMHHADALFTNGGTFNAGAHANLSKSSQEALRYIRQCLIEEYTDSQRVDYTLWRLSKKKANITI